MTLNDIIVQKIHNEGPLSFREFMEMALYYPGMGYYTSAKPKFGARGDYYTSPVISEVFGTLLARQLEEMWFVLGREPISIVEYGAGEGALAKQILPVLNENPKLQDAYQYIIIEKSEALIEHQQRLLPNTVRWIKHIDEIKGFNGVVISNEVLDNFAVHGVVQQESLQEVFVNHQHTFTEELRPAGASLKNYLKALDVELPKDFRTEICLEAESWLAAIAASMNRGFVLTIDYGYTKEEYFASKRSLGTLACYYKHTVHDRYYEHIGEQDITAHVNFSALNMFGKAHGLEFAGYTNQNYFLRALGLAGLLRNLEAAAPQRTNWFDIHKLIMDMGHNFKVMIQQKNVSPRFLTGLQFKDREP